MFPKFNVLSKLFGSNQPTATQTPTDGHTPTDRATLTAWAQEVIDKHFEDGAPFTVYDITREVRAAHPGCDVPHPVMRDVVHNDLMAVLIQAGLYGADRQQYGDRLAVVYTPRRQDPTYAPA